MANEPLDHEHAELKKRATRRLIVAVTLVLAAVAVLTILGREKTAVPPVATAPVTPIIAPPLAPPPSVAEPAPEAAPTVPEPAPAAAPVEPPPPPKVVNNQLRAVPPEKSAARPLPPATRMEPAPPAAPQAPAKAPEKAAPKAPAEPAAAKGYVVQLGVFSNYANAQALQAKLEQAGIKSYAETRVNVGPFQNKAEADQAMAKIRALGIGAVVVPAH